jgi:hypothetical protein
MKKKLLIKESAFTRLLQSFFGAKAKGNENEWIGKLLEKDPEVAQAVDRLDKMLKKNATSLREKLKAKGIDTKEIDDLIQRIK